MDVVTLKTQKENEERVAEEYLSSLSDLNCNSKPLINMLTMLAEENIEFAAVIVKVVEQHIAKVSPDIKLPILYLIDSIVKNVKSTYVQLFSQCIVNIFCGVFEKVNEKVRERMYALRQTWNEVFSAQKLYALDVKVKRMDVNWPITAKQPSIHVNPNFLKTVNAAQAIPTDMEEILHAKTRELLELKKRKLELELEATKKHLEEQEKQLTKATESVIPPPADALVAPIAGAGAMAVIAVRPPGMPPQLMPPANHLQHHQMPPQNQMAPGLRPPGMFQQFRNVRPHMAPNAYPNNMPQGFPMNNTAGKSKVHPVSQSMLNSVRQRDPRLLAREQQHQHIQHTMPIGRGMQKSAVANTSQQIVEDTKNNEPVKPAGSKSNSRNAVTAAGAPAAAAGFERKSPSRHSSSSSRSSSSGRSSSKSSLRDKDRERKRTAYSSEHRRKNGGSSLTDSQKSKCEDKDAFEIAPLSSAFKRKSSSPASSPTKAKDSKRSPKYRNNVHVRNNRNNRPRSPSAEKTATTSKDVDLRIVQKRSSPEKRLKLSTSPIHEEVSNTDVTERKTTANVVVASESNDLDKKNLSTVTTAKDATIGVALDTFKQDKPSKTDDDKTKINATTTIITTTTIPSNDIIKPDVMKNEVAEVDTKKRPSAELLEEEVLLPKKKIKQTKLDTLFGTEDVDLRTVPPQMLAVQQASQKTISSEILTPPPPPVISDDEKVLKSQVVESINDNQKTSTKPELSVNSNVSASPLKKSSLDDVRAKLAKAAKYNKLGKSEKPNNASSNQRLKLAELHMNEDTLEANDDKIRTIISQAQELHESGSINQEQYKNLVQTVMSLNKTNKLKEAKRRESLAATKSDVIVEILDETSLERMAARDAILKKRIPKLSKHQNSTNDHKSNDSSRSLLNEQKPDGSPIYEDKVGTHTDSNATTTFKQKIKEKPHRNKPSKWGERVVVDVQQQHPTTGPPSVAGPNSNWMPGPGSAFNKRAGFSGRAPHPPLPPLPNPNLRLPQMTLPSPWQIGAGVVPPPPFAPTQVPILRSSVPPPPQPPVVGLPPIPAAPLIPKPCNSIDNPQADMVRSITIDGLTKEIRIYDKIAIVFMELDQPREIGFQAGQRSIIIDNMDPLALKFNDEFKQISIDGELHRVRFGFPSRELYIDDHWYEIYFGGPAVSIPLKNKFHMLKAEGPPPQVNIGALRRDLVLGKINMIVDALIIVPIFLDAKQQTFRLGDKEHTIQFADNLLTVLLDGEITSVEYGGLPKRLSLGGTEHFIRFGALPQGIVPGKVFIKDMIYIKTEPPTVPIEVIPEVMPIVAATEVKDVEFVNDAKTEVAVSGIPKIPAAALTNFNIDELFQKLVSSGILGAASAALPAAATTTVDTKTEKENAAPVEEVPPQEVIKPINLSKPEHIKTRQAAIVSTLFSGMQCSSCGVRFPPEQTIKYSQHLDWHFRQNRRERDSTRKAHSRKWYYSLSDWVQYEEIEDLEDREKNFFESQQNDLEVCDDVSNQRSTNSPAPSCAAGPEDVDRTCDVCHEKFEQFYNEELEEWHMRLALRIEDKIYHPLCYEDYKASLNPPVEPLVKENDVEIINADDDNAMDTIIKIEGDNTEEDEAKISVTINDDDDFDDDVIVLPNEEPSVTEIVDDDDDEYIPANVTREEMGVIDDKKDAAASANKDLNDTAESDVEIQEPNIPFTDLDTYEEKELPEGDETSQMSFRNVKIKEEPKDEDDEDDGFEDVGTVVIAPDEEISIQSSEGTPTHIITSSTSAPSPAGDRPPSAASQHDPTSTDCTEVADVNISLDGTTDLEPEDDHNLSTAGPAPAIPVTSLVNKIKINITKNIISTNSSSSTTTSTTTTNSLNSNELNSVNSNNGTIASTTAISTIPVLCGGTSTATTSARSSGTPPADSSDNGAHYSGGSDGGGVSAISVIGSNMNVSSISVIGSYGSTSHYHHTTGGSSNSRQQSTVSKAAQVAPAPTPAPAKVTEKVAPAEEVIEYKLKPALEKVKLKKEKKVECGVETSGLCSIM